MMAMVLTPAGFFGYQNRLPVWTRTNEDNVVELLAFLQEVPGPAIVVTSGGVIAALAAALVVPEGAPIGPVWARFNTVIANTSVTRVIVGVSGPRLLTFNEHPHLSRELVTYR